MGSVLVVVAVPLHCCELWGGVGWGVWVCFCNSVYVANFCHSKLFLSNLNVQWQCCGSRVPECTSDLGADGIPNNQFFPLVNEVESTRSSLPNINRVKFSTITERFDNRMYSLIYMFVSVQKSQGQCLFHAVQDSVTNAVFFRGLLLWKSCGLKKKNLPSWPHYPGFKCTLQLL